jgi:hypothetical protein
MNAPKLKNISIVDQIKERVGSTNFFDIKDLVKAGSDCSLEETIESQKACIKANQDSAEEIERRLEKETDEDKIESLIKSLIFHKDSIENTKHYLNSIQPENG